MTTAWRGENEGWSVEDEAAYILAAGFGCGSGWWPDYFYGKGTAWRPGLQGDEKILAATEGLRVIGDLQDFKAVEQAHRAIHPNRKKQPEWVRALPENQREKALAWSATHSLKSDGPNRVRQFKDWREDDHYRGSACMPHVRSGSDVAAALAMARLSGPLMPLLLLYALQDETQTETVLRYACACGARPEIARDALVRVLSPGRITRGDAKTSLRMRRSEYSKQMRTAQARLEQWLHRAAVEFLCAYLQPVRKRPGASRFLANDLYR